MTMRSTERSIPPGDRVEVCIWVGDTQGADPNFTGTIGLDAWLTWHAQISAGLGCGPLDRGPCFDCSHDAHTGDPCTGYDRDTATECWCGQPTLSEAEERRIALGTVATRWDYNRAAGR